MFFRERPETRLMILGARERPGAATLDAMCALSGRCKCVDTFVADCQRTKTYPLVLASLEQVADRVQGDFVAQAVPRLREAYDGYWSGRGARVTAVLRLVRRTLSAARVRFMTLKGFPLARAYYVDPMMRVCADVDVMIHPRQIDAALGALDGVGIHPMYRPAVHEAKMMYADKAELIHGRSRIQVDASWSDLGNAGIGRVSSDSTLLWRRARRVGRFEWRLSPEDDLFFLIRHLVHGHDFDHALLQCCCDVAAILRTGALDWDYIARSAKHAEFFRACGLFAHFYDTSYRDPDTPSLGDRLAPRGKTPRRFEGKLFSKAVFRPLLERRIRPRLLADIVYGNLCFTAKLWAVDRLDRLRRLVLVALRPSRNELILLGEGFRGDSLAARLIHHYGFTLPMALPGLALGASLRMLAAFTACAAPRQDKQRETHGSGVRRT